MYAEAQMERAVSPKSLGQLTPISQTLSLLNQLREAQNDTSDAIGELAARLADVLTPDAPEPCDTNKASQTSAPSTSPLCEELERRLSIEISVRRRIHGLLGRLTV